MGSRAANKAAQTQSAAANQQAQEFQRMLAEYNPQIMSTAQQARGDVLGAATAAGQNLTDVAERGATGITGAATQANEYLQPYLGLGTEAAKSLGEMMAPGGQLNRNFTFEDMQGLDPGYQFRLDQANRALAGSAAAKGGALGGGALKAAMSLSQNLASSEYGAAFDRFRAQQGDRFGRFSNLMDMGVRTGALAGGNVMNAAQQAAAMRTGAAQTAGGWNIGANEYGGNALQNAIARQSQNAFNTQQSISDLMTGGAAARAAGTMGSANAWSGALGGIANTANEVGRYYREQDQLEQMKQGGYGYGGGGFTPYNVAVQNKGYYNVPQSPYLPNPGYPSSMNPNLQNWMGPTGAPAVGGYPAGSQPNYWPALYPQYSAGGFMQQPGASPYAKY